MSSSVVTHACSNLSVPRFYVVRLADDADAATVAACEPLGKVVCAPTDRVAVVSPETLCSRGCDASDVYDEELPAHAQDFSDDEEQANAKAAAKKRSRDAARGTGAPPPPPDAVFEGPPRPPGAAET